MKKKNGNFSLNFVLLLVVGFPGKKFSPNMLQVVKDFLFFTTPVAKTGVI